MKKNNYSNIYFKKIALYAIALMLFCGREAHSEVAIKVVVVNPSDSEEREVPVKYDLPPGLKLEDVKDAGGLKVEYDSQLGVYYVAGSLKLGPKENRVLKLVVNDIWIIPEEKIKTLKDYLEKTVEAVEEPEKKKIAEAASQDIKDRISVIEKEQQEFESDIEKRVQKYYVALKEINTIKDDIFAMDRLAKNKEAESTRADETLKLIIQAQNPTPDKLEIPLKYYLSNDVHPEDILDFAGFDFKYDVEKGRSYLEKKETFEPQQTKRWDVKVRNRWVYRDNEVENLIDEAEKTRVNYEHSKFRELSQALLDEIKREGGYILSSQKEADTIDKAIEAYKVNQNRFNLIKDDLLKLQSLASKDTAKKHNVLRDMKLMEEIKQISDVLLKKIFQEGKISLFKMILGVLIFVAVVTSVALFAWYQKFQKDKDNYQNILKENSGVQPAEDAKKKST
ncbi:MAG TPA: hypothetical protein PKY78_01200 [Candidatus Omnitrophota bacterium]|nr:hypothetical protein [Candidatus Omnitrophota bacterium]